MKLPARDVFLLLNRPFAVVRPCRQRGGSLIEALAVLAILIILAAMGAPSMASFTASRNVESVARQLADDMALARQEAVKRNTRVLVCPGASGSACTAPQAATDWTKGWRVCQDAGADGECDPATATDPNPIRVRGALDAAVSVTGPLSEVRFNPDGTTTSGSYSDYTVDSTRSAVATWRVRFAASGAVSLRRPGS